MKPILCTLLLTFATLEITNAQETTFESFRLPGLEPPTMVEPRTSGIDTTTYANRATEAYNHALAEGKFTVYLFRSTPNRFWPPETVRRLTQLADWRLHVMWWEWRRALHTQRNIERHLDPPRDMFTRSRSRSRSRST